MILYDNHTHCEFSSDGRMKIEDAIKGAIESSLSGIAFTDHFDLDLPESNEQIFTFDPKLQQSKINFYKSKYDLSILKGVELGLQTKSLKNLTEFLSKYSFDTIIASVHFVDGLDPYHGDFYKNHDAKSAYTRYLETILENITLFSNFDILGHFDYIVRYAPYKECNITLKEYPDHLDSILRLLAESGKAFEINTNTYRERDGRHPELDLNILKRFRELGGEAISLGSDAHDKFRIGENFEKYIFLLKECGFRYLVHYKNRKAIFEKI